MFLRNNVAEYFLPLLLVVFVACDDNGHANQQPQSDPTPLARKLRQPNTEQRPRATTDPSAKVLTGRIVRVTDGDTVTLLDGNKNQHKIRLKHIDTPESNQDFGSQAKKAKQ